MAKVTFDSDRCKGCALCVDACPKKIIVIAKNKINAKGHSPAEVTQPEKHRLRFLRHDVPRLRDNRGEMR